MIRIVLRNKAGAECACFEWHFLTCIENGITAVISENGQAAMHWIFNDNTKPYQEAFKNIMRENKY